MQEKQTCPPSTSHATKSLESSIQGVPRRVRKRIKWLLNHNKVDRAEQVLIHYSTLGPTGIFHRRKPINRLFERAMDRWMVDLIYPIGIVIILLILRWLLF